MTFQPNKTVNPEPTKKKIDPLTTLKTKPNIWQKNKTKSKAKLQTGEFFFYNTCDRKSINIPNMQRPPINCNVGKQSSGCEGLGVGGGRGY